jgi:integrase
MASIRKRNGKYQVQVRRSGEKSITKSFHRRSDAMEWSRGMEVKLDRGDIPISRKELGAIRLSEIIVRYRDEISIKKKSHNSEKFILNAFLKTNLANMTLSQVHNSDFSKYRDKRLKSVKAGTVNRELSIIKHALDIARNEWGYPIGKNPLTMLKKMKVQNGRERRLKPEEYNALSIAVEQTQNPFIWPVICFALETAMRRGEILSCRYVDIDYMVKVLHIPETKNGYSRTIPLTDRAIEILYSMPDGDNPFPITANSLRMAWDRLTKRAGVKDLHFHDLRHEAVSRFFERGLSIPEVALISGHRDYRMLARYTHLKAEDIARKL